jgi:hypothetical protein
MAPAPDGSAKLSINFGKKKSGPSKPPVRAPPRSTLQDSDDEDASEQRVEQVSHFDQAKGGAINTSKPKEEKAPLVIQKQSNRDWRLEAQKKRQRSALPNGGVTSRDANAQGDVSDKMNDKPIAYGLTVVDKLNQDDQMDVDDATPANEPSAPEKPKTDDELAMQALLGEKPKSSMVLPAVENEEESFQRDYRDAPDMATLDEYAAVPVEEFGAALLRGMGWKDGEAIGKSRGQQAKARVVERRPALLGLGAKEEAAVTGELGAWGKGAKGKRKVDEAYNPVLLRDTKTGEQMTEEELKAREEQEKKDAARGERRRRSRSRGRRESDDDRPSKRKRRDDDDYERSRRDERRRDDRRKESSRHYDDDYRSSRRRDDDYSRGDDRRSRYRDSDRDRNGDSRKERDRDRDRRRSRSPHRSSRRDRSRSRDDRSRRKDDKYSHRSSRRD